ncbi:MAG: hypothetical protein GYA52_00390 [Chloroflexi bacterium]|nr:hypothetical protein [Chloroflexota bacterium]
MKTIQFLDVSKLSYAERVCAAALQGLVNRSGACLYLDYGVYDDPTARRTNENFIDDELWYGKYRAFLGNQDQHNLDYYRQEHGFAVEKIIDLPAALELYKNTYKGIVIWDEALPDTVNAAIMLAGQENLLPLTSDLIEKYHLLKNPVLHDLHGRWADRLQLYTWALDTLFTKCKPGVIACVEPGWQRPEFVDYLVQEKVFTYSLASRYEGLGSQLLMLLAFGPPALREALFALHLDAPIRKYALRWMGKRSAEVRLSNRIQQAVRSDTYPTIFGWHTRRDDELAFMLQLSANGLRLVPAHMAGNFSFHSRIKPLERKLPPKRVVPELDAEGIYLTFTLSDGDQLMMMHTGELGNWYSPARGRVPFNWEVQPLLDEMAPALLDRYFRQASSMDCLIAGPSGAGYVIPPLISDHAAYLKETGRMCEKRGIKVVTSYIADPCRTTLGQLERYKCDLLGYLAGYAVVTRALQICRKDLLFFSNQVPTLEEITLPSDELLKHVQARIDAVEERPAFIAVHLFAYRTTVADVAGFASQISDEHIHVVRGDEFLSLFSKSKK